jgi:hypothetical protein
MARKKSLFQNLNHLNERLNFINNKNSKTFNHNIQNNNNFNNIKT